MFWPTSPGVWLYEKSRPVAVKVVRASESWELFPDSLRMATATEVEASVAVSEGFWLSRILPRTNPWTELLFDQPKEIPPVRPAPV